jgi:glycerophosphoryl diester phosphodiesterase
VTIEIVAHRAGNDLAAAVRAAALVDRVELDVHLWRGRLEVRHAKRLWPTRRLWERWHLLASDVERVSLEEVLATLDPSVPLWIDVKAVTPRLARRAMETLSPDRDVVVSSKSRWALRPFRSRAGTVLAHSAGNRIELVAMRAWHRLRPDDVDAWVVHQRLVGRQSVRDALASGLRVYSWGCVDVGCADRLVSMGVAGLIVDDIDTFATGRWTR